MKIDTMPKVTLTDKEYKTLEDAYEIIKDISILYEDEHTDIIRLIIPNRECNYEQTIFETLENLLYQIIWLWLISQSFLIRRDTSNLHGGRCKNRAKTYK